ncbi:MAG: hypothetical protein JEY99_15720 [Spirochaetales bacterium]|nr:hypothetical protein [Spirochaetales bacterium]
MKQQVLTVCRKLSLSGLVTGTVGDVCAKGVQTSGAAIKPGVVPRELEVPEDIFVICCDGSIPEQIYGIITPALAFFATFSYPQEPEFTIYNNAHKTMMKFFGNGARERILSHCIKNSCVAA